MSLIAKLMLLFTLIPIVEISILIPLHGAIGGWETFALVCTTALLGTFLTRWQGSEALRRIKEAIQQGKLPGDEIIDGVLVLLAGATLITPGVLTDTTGLLLLIPVIRAPVRRALKRRVDHWLADKATTGFDASFGGDFYAGGDAYGDAYGDPYGYGASGAGGAGGDWGRGPAIDITPEGADAASAPAAEPEPVPARPAHLGKPDAIL